MRPAPPQISLSAGNVLAALLLATAAASALTASLFVATTLLSPHGGGLSVALPAIPLAFFFACPIWLSGLVTIGGPCWWILHRSEIRSTRAAALAGALLTLSVAGGYLALSQSPKDAPSLDGWSFVAALSAIGGLTGWILVKTAYQQSVAR